jgi:7,8-dihydropterin-6-yl-methyl-4-(beta-D-ribofuranosyl)aminobenzene 5'-phosphate synthase
VGGSATCRSVGAAVLLLLAPALEAGAADAHRLTILYDAFGPRSALEKDWGFAALVEYGGRRVLFDTGNDAGVFERNVERLGVDLAKLDAVVISHRHGDHTTGLAHLLSVNPGVPIWTPREGAFFKSVPPREFLARHPGLPESLRYFDGGDPARWVTGTPWPQGQFRHVVSTTEILPGFFVLSTPSHKPGTLEMNEVSLAVRTPRGLAVVVGCAHPGVETILARAAAVDPRLHLVAGGFHLVRTPTAEIERVAALLHDDLRVERVAPGHCTGEGGFAAFRGRFEERFVEAGLGAVLPLPPPQPR